MAIEFNEAEYPPLEISEYIVYCSDCKTILYSAAMHFITNLVAESTARGHAEARNHNVVIWEREEII